MDTPVSVACAECRGRLFFVSAIGDVPAAINLVLTCTDCGNVVNAAVLSVWAGQQETAF